MDLPRNTFKAALKAGKRQIGIWNTIPDNVVVEMLAGCGYDWMLIDTEHSPVDAEGTVPLLQAVGAYPVSPVVRPSWNNPVEIKKVLDGGAQTLLIPYVQNADEAAAAAAAARYPPVGIRGVSGSSRASRYGLIKDYVQRAHEETCLLVQVETAAALAEIENIARVEGVDGIFIGPADLAASMGYPGQPTHPEVKRAVVDGIRRITAAGVPAGFLSGDKPMLQEVSDAGAKFIAVNVDMVLLRQAALTLRAEWE